MTSFTSFIIYRKEWALKWLAAIVILLAIGFLSRHYLNSKFLAIALLILLALPFIFSNRIVNYFTRKVIVELNENDISFDIIKLGSDEQKQIRKFKLLDIASYQIQFPTRRFASLIIKLNSGRKYEFTFRRQSLSDTQIDTNALIETMHKCFEQHEIEFVPSFYASQKGLYTIVALLFFLCIPIGIAIYLNKNVALTIIGSSFIMVHIISRRMADRNFYNKWKRI